MEIAVGRAHRGSGLSYRMLAALRDAARAAGLARLVAPVRPAGKHRCPAMPMAGYIAMRRGDGLPADPWLRVHIRAGGRILRVAPASMVMAGSLAEWRAVRHRLTFIEDCWAGFTTPGGGYLFQAMSPAARRSGGPSGMPWV
ncbi:MAG: hypothetical protein ACLQDY_14415 [Streptosporangiaceae bacterium]